MDLHEFTIETMTAHLADLAPAATVEAVNDTITLKVEGFSTYLRAKSEPVFGLGLGWSFSLMGPSEWDENGPDESVKRFSVTRTDQVRQVVDQLAEKAWSDHRASSHA